MIVLLMVYHVVEIRIVREVKGFFGTGLESVIVGSRRCSCPHFAYQSIAQSMACDRRMQALCRSDGQTY